MPRKKYWKKGLSKKKLGKAAVLRKRPLGGESQENAICRQPDFGLIARHNSSPTVIGSFHQGDVRFGENSGKQCVTNSFSAILFNEIKRSFQWDGLDLDRILYNGNELYSHIRASCSSQYDYLFISQLPQTVDMYDTTFCLNFGESLSGLLNHDVSGVNSSIVMSFENAVNKCLLEYTSCFITFAQSTMAVIRHEEAFSVFDSHSRSPAGLRMQNGTRVCIHFRRVEEVIENVKQLATSIGVSDGTQFEVTGMSVHGNELSSQMDVTQNPYTSHILREDKSSNFCSLQRKKVRKSNSSAALRYTTDEVFREKKKRLSRERYAEDAQYKLLKKSNSVTRYKESPSWRNAVNQFNREKYANNQVYRETVKQRSLEKYAHDNDHKEAVKTRSKTKYQRDLLHQQSLKVYSKQKYAQELLHKKSVKSYSKQKYERDVLHKQSVKAYSKQKYERDLLHQKAVKTYSTQKYGSNTGHRNAVKDFNANKYRNDERFKAKLKICNINRKVKTFTEKKCIQNVINKFKATISHGPEYVCSVCHRRLFENQVRECNKSNYVKKGAAVSKVANQCITETYLHTCSSGCDTPCTVYCGPCGKLWICYSCHQKVSSNKVPAESSTNDMELQSIPPELSCLNSLEQHLVALHIPFMKLVPLPKGRQNAVHGPVVCVPNNINKSVQSLPRTGTDDQMIQIKLKRKLTYKGHYEYQFISKSHLRSALQYLKTNNKWYVDVQFDEGWINPLPVIEEENNEEREIEQEKDNLSPEEDCLPDLTVSAENENGMVSATCLQPVDIGQEVLDHHFESITCLAPAEGNDPIRLLMDEGNEGKAFPVLFPTGSPIFHNNRREKITLSRYLNNRLMNADARFAKNVDYIFYSQYISELNQVISNVSIALRKGSGCQPQRPVGAENLSNPDSLRQLLKNDEGYKFLKPIRGTPPFWQSAQKDIFAMIRQLGIPTWFCSFSSAEMRWPEIVEAILKEIGDTRKAESLDWSEKCYVLRQNPVTAARMFHHKFHFFLKQVIMSPAQPIGNVVDFFYRVEFQQRGSPHTHCLFWIQNAPKVDKDDDQSVTDFIDKYVTCTMPPADVDPELQKIVDAVQKHSTRHSKTCRKKGTACRFGFPRPPSSRTFISRPYDNEVNTNKDYSQHARRPQKLEEDMDCDKTSVQAQEAVTIDDKLTKECATAILQKIWKTITDSEKEFESVEALFQEVSITQETFEKATNTMTKKISVVLKRDPADVWVNQYNPDLLRCWDANLDIQFVTDAFACVVYIISYISKAEKEMGLLLENTQKEIQKDGNVEAKKALRAIGNQYLTHREVSAQESVFRVCNLPLKEGSRKVQFVPTGENRIRMSLPLASIKRKQLSGDLENEDLFMTSLQDRYRNRPNSPDFTQLCQASFASEYRVLSSSQISKPQCNERVHELLNGFGFIQKRSRSQPAVVRFARISPTKDPENYYRSMLELFLPHRNAFQLKPTQFEFYKQFYEAGSVFDGSQLTAVKTIVEGNKEKFVREEDQLEEAEKVLEQSGELEDAWAQICPEAEVDRLECLHQKSQSQVPENETEDSNIPDLLPSRNNADQSIQMCGISREEAINKLKSLNTKQREIFYTVRQWCLDKANGHKPDPFYLFVTGGAGTGKSHLIQAIQYEASRILARSAESPDDLTVLLTAPTGVAAFNIGAATLHNTFSIPTDAKLPYQPLGDEKINSLRSKLRSLQIVIIDEISMVDNKMLSYIHGRLRQIKQTGNHSSFGATSVVAVGDFYQLPPVKGKSIFLGEGLVDLWNTNFKLVELTEIMRQKDANFAELLNRLRKRKKGESLRSDDIQLLSQCESDEECKCLHIFATNSEVDEFNIERLHLECTDPLTIEAQDFSRDPKTGNFTRRDSCHTRVYNTCLSRKVNLAEGARVMLTKNIDVSDGLVNGVFGEVVSICKEQDQFPCAVYVVFDDEKVGKKARKTQSSEQTLRTRIEPQEDRVNNSGGIRRQFPLKLAWACTIHKVQGLTVKAAVVSLDKIFAPGQAYVALSRVSSLEGLRIRNFNEKKIFCSSTVEAALVAMNPFVAYGMAVDKQVDPQATTIILHNTEGLPVHIDDMRCDSRFQRATTICLTETWLSANQPKNEPRVEGFNFTHIPRVQCYTEELAHIKRQEHGGVGVYTKEQTFKCVDLGVHNLEYLAFQVDRLNLTVAVLYRPQSYPMKAFRKTLKRLFNTMMKLPGRSIIMGDFNDNALSGSSIQEFVESHGFSLAVFQPTTESGTLLDHVYVRNMSNVEVDVLPIYYSFHEAVEIIVHSQ